MELVKQTKALQATGTIQYDGIVKLFNSWSGGKPANMETLEDFFRYMKKEYSPKYQQLAKVALKKSVLKSVTLDPFQKEKVDVFFRSIKTDKPELAINDSKIISRGQVQELIEKSPKAIGFFVRFLYNTGCRVSEMNSIKLKQCKNSGEHVLIEIIGKGSKQRTLTISSKFFEEIKTAFNSKEYLFQNKRNQNTKIFSRQHVSREITLNAMKLFNKNISAHCLRHSRITHLLKEKQSIEAVSHFAGHSDIKITLAIYSHNRLESETIISTGI